MVELSGGGKVRISKDSTLWKKFYGMSTKIAQKAINPNAKLKTSEGLLKFQKVDKSDSKLIQLFF